MTRAEYMKHADDLFAAGKVTEDVFWAMVENADAFCDPDPTITAIVKNPGEIAEVCEIDNDLDVLQEIVGGYIEIVTLGDDVVICNEEARILGLPYNCTLYTIGFKPVEFYGPIIICGADLKTGEFTDVRSTLRDIVGDI